MGESNKISRVNLTCCSSDLILFTVQVALIFVVVCVSLMNLTYSWGNQNLWTVVLTSCLGYIMPNPKIKINNGQVDDKSINNLQVSTNE